RNRCEGEVFSFAICKKEKSGFSFLTRKKSKKIKILEKLPMYILRFTTYNEGRKRENDTKYPFSLDQIYLWVALTP
ncbi:MAG: hypothetical protein LIO67_05070, partial [Lachnospiraceae bacterium]|nr:hypothetical protein [Lachnospiraceae bacterium]